MSVTSTEKGETAIIGIPGMFWKLSKDGETVVRADLVVKNGRWRLHRQGQRYEDSENNTVATEELAIQWITAASLVVMLGG